MSFVDRLVVMFTILAIGFTIVLTSYEVGKKVQCESDPDFVFSYDYSKCVKLGYENIYRSEK